MITPLLFFFNTKINTYIETIDFINRLHVQGDISDTTYCEYL